MILVCGDIILDESNEYISKRISPEAPVPILILKRKKFFLGGAANVVNNIKNLSTDTFLIGSLGKDDAGLRIKKLLKKNKVKHKLICSNQYITTHKKRGFLKNKLIFRIDEEKEKKLSLNHQKFILNFVKKNISKFNLLILSDYNKGFFCRSFLRKISLVFKLNNKLIITNPKKKNVEFYKYSNILVPNEKEFNSFISPKRKINKKAEFIFKKLKDLKYLIITRGNKNVLLVSSKNKIKYLKVKKVKSIDVTGASDTFLATISVFLNKNLSIYGAINKAIKASKNIVTKKFTSIITMKEIEN